MGKVLEVIFQRISLTIIEKSRNITELLLNDGKSTLKIKVFADFSVKLQDFQNSTGNVKLQDHQGFLRVKAFA